MDDPGFRGGTHEFEVGDDLVVLPYVRVVLVGFVSPLGGESSIWSIGPFIGPFIGTFIGPLFHSWVCGCVDWLIRLSGYSHYSRRHTRLRYLMVRMQ